MSEEAAATDYPGPEGEETAVGKKDTETKDSYLRMPYFFLWLMDLSFLHLGITHKPADEEFSPLLNKDATYIDIESILKSLACYTAESQLDIEMVSRFVKHMDDMITKVSDENLPTPRPVIIFSNDVKSFEWMLVLMLYYALERSEIKREHWMSIADTFYKKQLSIASMTFTAKDVLLNLSHLRNRGIFDGFRFNTEVYAYFKNYKGGPYYWLMGTWICVLNKEHIDQWMSPDLLKFCERFRMKCVVLETPRDSLVAKLAARGVHVITAPKLDSGVCIPIMPNRCVEDFMKYSTNNRTLVQISKGASSVQLVATYLRHHLKLSTQEIEFVISLVIPNLMQDRDIEAIKKIESPKTEYTHETELQLYASDAPVWAYSLSLVPVKKIQFQEVSHR